MAVLRKIKDGKTTIYPITADQAVFVGEDGTTLDEALNNKANKVNALSGFEGGLDASSAEGGAVGYNARSNRGGAVGNDASSVDGGAAGYGASTESGGAIGQDASSESGFAGGNGASADYGGAVGYKASATYGGAVGYGAKETLAGFAGGNGARVTGGGGAIGQASSATSGGAVGRNAKTSTGFAGGYQAKTVTSTDEPIDAIQLGAGTNSTAKTLQVYNYQLMDASGNIPQARLLNAFSGLMSISSNKFNSSGADYAEYFEWVDSNSNDEDRRGLFVTCIEDKIQLANPGDDIIGAISANPSVIGNTQEDMYEKDIFGAPIKDENGNYKLNPNYDPSKEYIPYSERPEFGIVGLLGQLIVVDDGTCTVGGYCTSSNNGIGTKSDKGYKVLKRIDSNHIKILIK